MMNDRYSKALLTVIAVALVADAARGWLAIPEAHAGETMKCEVVGEVKITGKVGIDTFGNPVVVKADDFAVHMRDDVPVKIENEVRVRKD